MDIISIARIESGSSLFLHIRNKSGLLFKLHMVYMSKALEIIQLVIARNVTMIQLCDFFFFITGSYSSRRGCFVWLTQKDTTICVQTYSELCLLIKRKKKTFINEYCIWNANFVPPKKWQRGQRKYFWFLNLLFWNVWKLTWLYFFVEKAADSPYPVHDRMVYVFIH